MVKIIDIECDMAEYFKTIIDVLKDVILDTNIQCRKGKMPKQRSDRNDMTATATETGSGNTTIEQKDLNYMKIFATDSNNTVLIDLKLEGKNFRKFYLAKKKITLGINVRQFYNNIKIINKFEYLTLTQDDEEVNILTVKINNIENQRKSSLLRIKLLDLEEKPTKMKETEIEAKIIMKSQEFHKICKEMLTIAEFFEIQCSPEILYFKCKGDTERITTYAASNEFISEIDFQTPDGTPKLITGIFNLKHLASFSKFQNLCSDIEIYMKNDAPLVIKYILPLGRLFLCISPQGNIDETFESANGYYMDDHNY